MLTEQLKRYDESNIYPFHMPGHKRRICLPKDAYHLDITEIDGFDNLHAASGILAEEQRRYADLVGAKQSYFLVNGSTCGILAAISATVPRKGTILIARNSHKSAYNAMYMRQLYAEYVYPEMTHLDIQGMICREQVEAILQTRKNISAVYLTSPTYDGIVSDIASIAQVVHEYNLPLIVDEAHGAHFGMHPMFPQSAVHLGADLVIQSVHKTLPAFTQSAVLHICSDRVSKEEIERFLAIYESSSPSYVLMAGISRARAFLETEGAERFGELEQNLKRFYEKTTNLRALHVMRTDEFEDSRVYAKDLSKILIRTEGSSINGKQLYDLLLKRYGLQLEMCSGEYVTALCTLMDEAEGFERLADALLEIDAALENCKGSEYGFVAQMYRKKEQKCAITEALEGKTEILPLKQACGRVSASYVYLYPPGIPLLVPGEIIDAEFLEDVEKMQMRGLKPEGLYGMDSICNDCKIRVY